MINSYLNTERGRFINRVSFLIWKWENRLRIFEELKTKSENQFLTIKYESILSDQEHTLNKIIKFLNLNEEHNFWNAYSKHIELMGIKDEVIHQNLTRPIQANRNSKWKEELDISIKNKIEDKLSASLKRYGYEI